MRGRKPKDHELVGGPYGPPRARVGGRLFCEVRGSVVVQRWSDGRIPWPLARPAQQGRGKDPFILCGDLAKAVRTESVEAVRHLWRVAGATVYKWRERWGADLSI